MAEQGLTEALFRAIQFENLRSVKSRLKHGASLHLELPFSNGTGTALHAAAAQNKGTKIAELLIKAGADVNGRNCEDRTPLHFAALSGASAHMVYFLIEEGANVSAQDDNGQTPLHMVSQHPDSASMVAIAQHLFQAGADVSIEDKEDQTPFDLASEAGDHAKDLKEFLKLNENLDPQQDRCFGYGANFREHNFFLKLVQGLRADDNKILLSLGKQTFFKSLNSPDFNKLVGPYIERYSDLKLKLWNSYDDLQPGQLKRILLRAVRTRDEIVLKLLVKSDALDLLISQNQLHGLLRELKDENQRAYLCQFWSEAAPDKVEECFQRATHEGDEEILKWIIQNRQRTAGSVSNKDDSLLETAESTMSDGDTEAMRSFIHQGGLHRMLQYGYYEDSMKVLAFIEACKLPAALLATKWQALSVLELACKLGQEDIVEEIHKLDPDLLKEMLTRPNQRGLTLAHFLAASKEPEAKLMKKATHHIKNGSLLTPDTRGFTPVQLAIENNQLQLTKYFLDRKSALASDGCPSPMWLCAVTNNVTAAQILLKYLHATDIETPAPDTSTPYLVVRVMAYPDKELISLLEEHMLSADVRKVENYFLAPETLAAVTLQEDLTAMQLLCQGIPLFNESVSPGWNGHVDHYEKGFPLSEAIAPFVLEVCGLQDAETATNKISHLVHVLHDRCSQDHKNHHSNRTCSLISDLIRYLSWLEDYIRKDPKFENLDPSFSLIGSIMECTRLGLGNEIDCQVDFQDLRDSYFVLGETAFGVGLTQEGKNYFEAVGLGHLVDGDCFDHVAFLRSLFTTLLEAINVVKLPSRLSVIMKNEDYNGKACPECRKVTEERFGASKYPAQCHCMNCLPAVTMTRLGPCLIFQWHETKEASPVLCSIDLIPVFPLGASTQEAFREMVKTLVQKRPEGWVESFKKYLCRDRIISRSLVEYSSSRESTNFAFKIQHFGPSNNYIVRAGQVLDREAIEDPLTKRIYIYLKGLKVILKVSDLKSYFIKKVLSKPEITNLTLQTPNELQLFFEVINQPEMRPFFEDLINYDYLKDGLMNEKTTIVINRKYRSGDK